VSSASLKRDIDCFIRTYLPSRRARTVHEETLDCPLIELGLLREDNGNQTYQLVRGPHSTLPLSVFAYALADYLNRRKIQTKTVNLNDLAFGAGAPGRVFCLNESGLLSRLEALRTITHGALVYDETAGLKQVFLHQALHARTLLERYYAATRKGSTWARTARVAKR
jgi:hypothetical protein